MDKTLIAAVRKQLDPDTHVEWVRQCHEIAEHGASTGWSGFSYYTDTLAFYAKNQALIAALVDDLAEELDVSPIDLVLSFRCLQGTVTAREVGETLYGHRKQHNTTVANALAWFALEEVARHVAEG